uniref:holo-[acyl-carrier-protein] synthase n=1 Tax=Ananas comosus var. bracteatus TaxID=296719 RepID=A0A6V7NFG7_ANACO|nr:unnamed protein product [Ananas comosus var. bracteatus]
MERGVRRWLVNISTWDPSERRFASLASLLPPHERPAIMRFVKVDDRKRALVSRLLQYVLVREVLGIPFDKITMSRTIEGKPYLQNNEDNVVFPNFNFNASHHGDYVGIASEPRCLVGLDIVSVSKPQKEEVLEFIDSFSSYFTVLEWKNILQSSSSDEILIEFYRYWCLKEAFVKAVGAGLGFGLHRLEFHHTRWTNISVCIDGAESKDWRFWLFELDERHLASIAKGHPREAVETYRQTLTKVDFEEGEFQCALQLPEHGFTSFTVDKLDPKEN